MVFSLCFEDWNQATVCYKAHTPPKWESSPVWTSQSQESDHWKQAHTCKHIEHTQQHMMFTWWSDTLHVLIKKNFYWWKSFLSVE